MPTSQTIPGLYGMSFSEDKVEGYIKLVMDHLENIPPDVGLVFRGVSGMIVGIRVVDRTGRKYAIVRKPNDGSHSSRQVEGWVTAKYVIVDDFIASGGTIKAIVTAINQASRENMYNPSKCVGIITYHGSSTCDFIRNNEIPLYGDCDRCDEDTVEN